MKVISEPLASAKWAKPFSSKIVALACFVFAGTLSAHDWHGHDDSESAPFALPGYAVTPPADSEAVGERADGFAKFFPEVRYFWDEEFFYIETAAFPDHEMMTGITAWQQQVPIPQPYFGENNWRIPLNPVKTATGVSAQTSLFRGAIAIAVNGVPIFNPIKNDGVTDTFLAGELDLFGGHCGRADDYHYHIYPWHLLDVVGETSPAAFALDGFPIYGDKEADGADVDYGTLDTFAGHEHDGAYHYHGATTYPYINGGIWTNPPLVIVAAGTGNNTNEGVEPQPTGQSVRPGLLPLADATITNWAWNGENEYLVTYSRDGGIYTLNVALSNETGEAIFDWNDAAYGDGAISPQTYSGMAVPPETPGTSMTITEGSGGMMGFLMTGEPGLGYPIYHSENLADWSIFGHRLLNMNGTSYFELDRDGSRGFLAPPSGTPGAALYEPFEPFGAVSTGAATVISANLLLAGDRVAAVGAVIDDDGGTWMVPAANDFLTATKAGDLYNTVSGVTPVDFGEVDLSAVPIVEVDPGGEVITGYLFADNYFELYVNGTLVGVDPVPYTPFNSCVVRFRAQAPITYAVKLIDWEENLGQGTELNVGSGNPYDAGDGGFIASFSDGTVTDGNWKAQTFYIAPVDHPSNVIELVDGTRDSSGVSVESASAESIAVHYAVPGNWASPGFDDSGWPQASTFTEQEIGVLNKPAYTNFQNEFTGAGASFVWSSNVVLDNETIVRFTSAAPTGAEWSMLKLPDTGQVDDNAVTFGEDSDYTIDPPSYTDNGNGTVTDEVTGLMWEQGEGGEMTWDAGATYCADLVLGGHSDWRMPTAQELFSIAHLNRRQPPLDAIFSSPGTANYWWASDERADQPLNAWALNRGGGIGPKPKSETVSAGGVLNYHVRAVRDVNVVSPAAAMGPRFTDNGDGTVSEANTGRQWQQGEAETMSWEAAIAYAEGLSLGGHDDWRLPNMKELFSMVDADRSGPAVDTVFFQGVSGTPGAARYWSSTVNFNRPDEPWYVDFQFGLSSFGGEATLQNVRCVRGGDEVEPPVSSGPNIILLVTDDIGYADLGVQGSTEFVSPAIDSIAANGVRFMDGYVSGAKCSPSRAGFLTGRYQQRFGHENNVEGQTGLPLTQTLIPGHMKSYGLNYRSYMVGKWHLGSQAAFLPNARGFDELYGFRGGFRSYFPIASLTNGTRL